MKLDAPENANYCATVVKIKKTIPLEGCDNVAGTPLFGLQAIISKNTPEGTIGIVFPAEAQLSEEYCYENNLHRHDDKNKNLGVKGYLEDNRRVRAIKFRGHRSDCLFMSLESLNYTGANISELKEGDEFDKLNGKEICRKYVIPVKTAYNRLEKNKERVFKRVDLKFMPEHFDSDNFFKYSDHIKPDQEIIVSQKIHGTSIRIANTIVRRKLSLLERLARKLGVKVQETEFDYVFGSRKVIKDINNPNQNHFYNIDLWTLEGKKLEGIIPENYILYGELVGWTPDGAPIQKDYTYQVPEKECKLYIYRVAFINNQGRLVDLSWDQMKEFCAELGLNMVVELWRGKMKKFKVEDFLDKRFHETMNKEALPLSGDKDLVDEGVCIRVEGLVPYILKAKSPVFLQHETTVLDYGAADLEAIGSVAEEEENGTAQEPVLS